MTRLQSKHVIYIGFALARARVRNIKYSGRPPAGDMDRELAGWTCTRLGTCTCVLDREFNWRERSMKGHCVHVNKLGMRGDRRQKQDTVLWYIK